MPRVRLIISLGLPDPDRLSTMLVWSLMGHIGLLIGALVYQGLPSAATTPPNDFFVRLAAAAPASGGAAAPSGPSKAPAETPKEPSPARPPPVEPALVPVPVKTVPREPQPAPRPRRTPPPEHVAPQTSPSADGEDEGEDDPGAGEAGGDSSGSSEGASRGTAVGTGVGGTSFGEGDFRYGWYQGAIESKLQSQWRKPIASSSDAQTTTVSFTIRRDGSVHDIEISSRSGNSALDLSVLRAVFDSNPLPALPRGWSGDSVHVSMEFRLTPGAP